MPPIVLIKMRMRTRATTRRETRKAQIQMAESITAVVIVTLLVVFGIMIYSKMQEGSIKEAKESQKSLSAVELAQKLSSLPELGCSSAATVDTGCLDYHKVKAFEKMMQDPGMQSYYFSIFGNAKIELQHIYPTYTRFDTIIIYENNADPDSKQSANPTFIPFSVMDSVTRRTSLGVLIVYSYSRVVS